MQAEEIIWKHSELVVTTGKNWMIRYKKCSITKGVDLGSINSPRRALTKDILFNWLQKIPWYMNTYLPSMEETTIRLITTPKISWQLNGWNQHKKIKRALCITHSYRREKNYHSSSNCRFPIFLLHKQQELSLSSFPLNGLYIGPYPKGQNEHLMAGCRCTMMQHMAFRPQRWLMTVPRIRVKKKFQ